MNNEEQHNELIADFRDKEEKLNELNSEIRETKEEQMQLEHQLERARNRASYQKRRFSPEYKARTRELIEKGGTVEHFYPTSKDLTGPEFYEVMEILHKDKEMRARFDAAIMTVHIERRKNDGTVSCKVGTSDQK